ncbi:oligouridylate-binding protein 1B-like protein [Tanacetum coccineum]
MIEPIPSGNVPPGFDPNTCRSVYVGNVHTQVTEPLLQEVFASTGPVEGCKLIRKDKTSMDSITTSIAAHGGTAILSLNEGICLTDAMLFAHASPPLLAVSIMRGFMWDQKTGRSRGFGFVSFRDQQDAQSAINDLTGKWLGSRQIRCNWATKGAGTSDEKQGSDSKTVVELTNGSSEDVKELVNSDAPENNPQYTTVFVGNLAPEVTQLELHRHFYSLGAGVIEEVRLQRDKGFGFVRYNNHAEAALAIQMGNTQSVLYGKQIKGYKQAYLLQNKLNPLPEPAPAPMLSAADLLAYERQLAMSKMAGVHAALMHPQAQLPLKQTMGMNGTGASQAIYDGGFQNVAAQANNSCTISERLTFSFPAILMCLCRYRLELFVFEF